MDIYFFGNGKAEGVAEMKNLLGGKRTDLAKKINLGRMPHLKNFMLVILGCYRLLTTKQPELPAPLIDLFNKEKHQERRKGYGSSFEAA